jgi:hypothetical protein
VGFAVTLVLLLVWLTLAYRQFQRGDLLLAGVFLAVGIVLTVYRLRRLSRPAALGNPKPPS